MTECSKTGVLLFLILFAGTAVAETIDVTFINPRSPENDFWGTVTRVMQAAADDLGMSVKVVNAHQVRFRHIETAREEAARGDKPDFLVTMFMRNSTDEVLAITEKAGIDTFVFNTALTREDQDELGAPREKFKHWIGHMYPDDYQAGYDLAARLIRAARRVQPSTSERPIQAVGISGNHQSPATLFRNAGLKQAVTDAGANLQQIAFSKWRYELARAQSQRLMKRYNDVTLYWSASDLMALAVMESARAAGKNVGEDIVTGGIDWMPAALQSIQSGEMTASVGGHFMEGGWVMVLLYDYYHGIDFADDPGTEIQSKMSLIDRDNVDHYLRCFGERDWDRIDFRRFSKALNPDLKTYDFSLETMLDRLHRPCEPKEPLKKP